MKPNDYYFFVMAEDGGTVVVMPKDQHDNDTQTEYGVDVSSILPNLNYLEGYYYSWQATQQGVQGRRTADNVRDELITLGFIENQDILGN